MFGFLRRKKAPPEQAAPVTAPAEPVKPADASDSAHDSAFGSNAEPPQSHAIFEPGAPTAGAPTFAPIEAAAIEPVAAPAEVSAPESLPEAASEATGKMADDAQSRDAMATAVAEPRQSWFKRLSSGLAKTRGGLSSFFSTVRLDESLYEQLETALLQADAGVDATDWLLERLRERVRRERLTEVTQVRRALVELVTELLMPLEQPIDLDRAGPDAPLVWLIAGVNGAGKTTSIGKIAHHLQREGKTVLLAAGDTFRAAAREQLSEWGARNNVSVVAQQGGDPAAVAFDAVSAARARKIGVAIIDTAGRLPTQQHLMQELGKIRRVLGKAQAAAPHESLLVLDGNTGQNMLAQVKAFDDVLQLTGLIITKLDGTAKGGALAALAMAKREPPIPVYFIGIGEQKQDLQAFSAAEFAQALLGDR